MRNVITIIWFIVETILSLRVRMLLLIIKTWYRFKDDLLNQNKTPCNNYLHHISIFVYFISMDRNDFIAVFHASKTLGR